MKSLDFERNTIKDLFQSKKELQNMFWSHIEDQVKQNVKDFLQQQINEEFDLFVGAEWYAHSEERQHQRNGYWYRSLETKYGPLSDLAIPRARYAHVTFTVFEPWQRYQNNLMEAILNAYLIGNSTQEVTELFQEFCGSRFSRQFVRSLLQQFNDQLQHYLNRTIAHLWPYVFIDGMRIRIKEGLDTKDRVVIWALGLDDNNNRSILGFVIAPTESRDAVETLLKDLKYRGLKPPRLIICDEAQQIISATRSEMPHTDIQICTLHKLKTLGRNLDTTKLSRKQRGRILQKASEIYQAPHRTEALRRFAVFKRTYKNLCGRQIDLFEHNFNLTLTFYSYPEHIHKTIKTNNLIERMNRSCRYLLRKYLYFHERDNARLALFTFVCRYEAKHNKSSDKALTLSFKKAG